MRPMPPRGRRPKRVSMNRRIRGRKYGLSSRSSANAIAARASFVGLRGLPLPPKLRTTLTYVQEGVSTGGPTGTINNFQYALNSVYDPYVTAGGHQPMGYDQLMAFYQFCCVDKCRVTVTFTPGTGTNNPPFAGVQFTENSSFAPSDLSVIAERGNVTYTNVPNVAGYNGKPIVVKRSWDASKWYPTFQKYDEQFANTATSGPSGELAYANVFILGPSAGTYSDIYYQIRLTYDVEFYGQVQLNQS